MKQIELELKKRLLIVEVDDNISTAVNIKIDDGVLKYDVDKYLDGNSNVWICNKKELSRKFELICKGSELTEEIADEFAEPYDLGFYASYDGHKYSYEITALESFISAIEAQGYYWGKHPYEQPIHTNYDEENDFYSDLEYWKEAESKTFNPEKTLIFEILL